MHISYSVHIDAPPARVWQATVDVERWPQFASQFQSIKRLDEGPLALESKARVTPKGFFSAVWVVTEYEEGRSFTWESDMLPGLHLVAGHVVEPADGGARVTMSLTSSGPAATLLGPALGRIFRRNVRSEGDGMKAFLEGGGP